MIGARVIVLIEQVDVLDRSRAARLPAQLERLTPGRFRRYPRQDEGQGSDWSSRDAVANLVEEARPSRIFCGLWPATLSSAN